MEIYRFHLQLYLTRINVQRVSLDKVQKLLSAKFLLNHDV
jgi:hypothetical protein